LFISNVTIPTYALIQRSTNVVQIRARMELVLRLDPTSTAPAISSLWDVHAIDSIRV